MTKRCCCRARSNAAVSERSQSIAPPSAATAGRPPNERKAKSGTVQASLIDRDIGITTTQAVMNRRPTTQGIAYEEVMSKGAESFPSLKPQASPEK